MVISLEKKTIAGTVCIFQKLCDLLKFKFICVFYPKLGKKIIPGVKQKMEDST